jgi:hypothetical protein
MCSRTYKNGYKPIKPRKAYKIGAWLSRRCN